MVSAFVFVCKESRPRLGPRMCSRQAVVNGTVQQQYVLSTNGRTRTKFVHTQGLVCDVQKVIYCCRWYLHTCKVVQ